MQCIYCIWFWSTYLHLVCIDDSSVVAIDEKSNH